MRLCKVIVKIDNYFSEQSTQHINCSHQLIERSKSSSAHVVMKSRFLTKKPCSYGQQSVE